MYYQSFEQIRTRLQTAEKIKRMAVAVANDYHTLEAAIEARQAGLAKPVLVGDKVEISAILDKLGEAVSDEDIYD